MDRSILCPRMRAGAADPKVSRLGAEKVCPDSWPDRRGKQLREKLANGSRGTRLYRARRARYPDNRGFGALAFQEPLTGGAS